MDELKSCPFCGSKAKLSRSRLKIEGIGYIYHVECIVCGAKSGGYLDGQTAKIMWNKRIKK